MKLIITIFVACLLSGSCTTMKQLEQPGYPDGVSGDTSITQSLFNDRLSTISEDNIQKILDGSYKLPDRLRVAIVKLESNRKRNYYWNDEDYLKTQQSYIDLFAGQLNKSGRVTATSVIPDLLLSTSPTFTNLREAAVRMQSDIVLVYSITSDIYSKYKLFSRTDIKAFATVQLIILDVRTGLIPFSTIVTKDTVSQKRNEELDVTEARKRIQNEAILQAINDIGQKINDWLGKK